MFSMRHLVLQDDVGKRKQVCICFEYKFLILRALISLSVISENDLFRLGGTWSCEIHPCELLGGQ